MDSAEKRVGDKAGRISPPQGFAGFLLSLLFVMHSISCCQCQQRLPSTKKSRLYRANNEYASVKEGQFDFVFRLSRLSKGGIIFWNACSWHDHNLFGIVEQTFGRKIGCDISRKTCFILRDFYTFTTNKLYCTHIYFVVIPASFISALSYSDTADLAVIIITLRKLIRSYPILLLDHPHGLNIFYSMRCVYHTEFKSCFSVPTQIPFNSSLIYSQGSALMVTPAAVHDQSS